MFLVIQYETGAYQKILYLGILEIIFSFDFF